MSAFRDVINEAAGDDEELRLTLSTAAMRYLNMVGGCRPSDAARQEVGRLERMGRDAYIADIVEHGQRLRKAGW